MEAVEHYAKIVLAARQLGTTRTLNQTQLEALVAARSRYRQNGN
jgi:hypothetical protein